MEVGDLNTWIFNLMTKGLAAVTHRYYGIYRAIVADNADPDKRGRVKIQCPQAGHSEPIDKWVMPSVPGAGNQRGMFFPPEKGDTVWISFYEGDPSSPEVYFGGWFGETTEGTPDTPKGGMPADSNFPEKKGIFTRAGHQLIFNDENGKESITILWNKPAEGDPAKTDRTKTAAVNTKASAMLNFDKNGSLMIKTPSSYLLHLNDADKTATLTSPNGSMFTISKDDAIAIIHKSGSSVGVSDGSIDISANTGKNMNVNISGANVILNGGGIGLGSKAVDFGVLGLKLIIWLAKHTHPTALGNTLPPVPPPTPADFLSKSVKIQE